MTAATTLEYDPFADAPLARAVPTTEPQREIWLASQLGTEASLAYNESVSLRMRGPLKLKALEEALQGLVDRHDALRATISDDGQSLLLTHDLPLHVAFEDRGDESPEAKARAVTQAQREAVEQPFDLVPRLLDLHREGHELDAEAELRRRQPDVLHRGTHAEHRVEGVAGLLPVLVAVEHHAEQQG